ncbi:class I SAM-dependent methyltransferase [Merismopedia glauca]|uniref:class I SAM-dependent methyltransferase n=1 Tax=Merismopedia glauca TaxID=292586 RepID=UPI0015E74CE8|nr:class I SAM-dependent methyltransferase [Merismopedia glauca]
MSSYKFEIFDSAVKEQEIDRLKRQIQLVVPPDPNFLQRVGLKPGMKGLDLGCGTGMTSGEIARFVDPGEVVGVDLSEAMVEKARWLQEREKISNLSFQPGSAEDLPFAEGSFDFVYARLLFQHLPQPERALANIYRILKPGGIFCGIDVDHSWFALHPEPESFTQLCKQLVIAQQNQGGDPFVGRKLGSYCCQARLVNVQTQVKIIDSDRIGLPAFFSLLSFGTPYRSHLPGADEITLQAREKVYALLQQPYTWAGFGMFIVTARKPQSA